MLYFFEFVLSWSTFEAIKKLFYVWYNYENTLIAKFMISVPTWSCWTWTWNHYRFIYYYFEQYITLFINVMWKCLQMLQFYMSSWWLFPSRSDFFFFRVHLQSSSRSLKRTKVRIIVIKIRHGISITIVSWSGILTSLLSKLIFQTCNLFLVNLFLQE